MSPTRSERLKMGLRVAQVIAAALVFVVSATYAASTYLGTLAKRDDLEAVTRRVVSTEVELRDVHAEMGWIHDQLIEISRAVNAPVINKRR